MKKTYLLVAITHILFINIISAQKTTTKTTNIGEGSGTGGNSNSFFGYASGSLTTGDVNSFYGATAGYLNTTGHSNTFLGRSAGFNNTTGYQNVFIGNNAGYYNTTANGNIFIGDNAGNRNTTGVQNTFTGTNAGFANTTGHSNTFYGSQTGSANTTAFSNTFIGNFSGRVTTTGYFNTFLGSSAGANNTTGRGNTFLGATAGMKNISGIGNVFLGYAAGYNETGNDKLYIDNSSTSTPLIFGDFASNKVGINTKTIPDYATLAIDGSADFTGDIITSGKIGIGTITPSAELDIQNGSMVIGGTHKDFIFHTQHWTDTSNRLFIAPKNNNEWDWSKQLVYHDNGDFEVNGKLSALHGIFDSSSRGDDGWIPVSIGREYDTDRRTFEFVVAPTDTGSGYTSFGITDQSKILRYDFVSKNTHTWIDLDNHNNQHFFKVSSADDLTYIHMPLPKSRIVIGEYGGYLADKGYNLVVKGGPAMIEDAIYTNGHIGIGTTDTQGYELAVNGSIHSQEVVVDLEGWPDYVFKKEYDLPTLQQVEEHIIEKGHLINIPSETEVLEKGIKLGEINSKLLEKIEELTLYTIDQEKKIKAQNERLARLESLLLKK
ncbi:autotransporter outer membrane beta-barrel domain-containing protein [Aquimarina pacifica]|uniref:hypothetical protein n=1 Tax=Aquimarina pacifica TaxID=1296415 RepID=UPI000471570F|nr:hypothetical protein [Aquimarina pacifica]